jgi:YD repeat-containing protein
MMRNMRKITALCLCVLLMLSLTGCNHTGQTFAAKPPTAEQLAAAKAAEQTPMRPKTWHTELSYSGLETWGDFFYDEQGNLIRIEEYIRYADSMEAENCTYRCARQPDGTTKIYRTQGSHSALVMTLNPAGQCVELISTSPHEYTYDEQGRLVRETWDNERSVLRWYWDDHNRLTGMDGIDPGVNGWTTNQYLKWHRDENGDVIRMESSTDRWALPKNKFTMEYAWAYENDEAGRLAAKVVEYGMAGDPERQTMEVLRYLYDDSNALCGIVTCSRADILGLYPYTQMIYSAPEMQLTALRKYCLTRTVQLNHLPEIDLDYRRYRIVWEVVPE